MRQNAGFTLAEALVVTAIIVILAAMTAAGLVKTRQRARQVQCLSKMRQVGFAFEFHVSDSGGVYPHPDGDDPVSTDPYCWYWMGRGWRGAIVHYLDGVGQVLFCPSDPMAHEKWDSTSYGYSMAFYHSPAQIDAMDGPQDTYSNAVPTVPQTVGRVGFPSKKVMLAEWLSNHFPVPDDQGWWCWEGRRNALFADGHADLLAAEDVLPANDGLPDFNLTLGGIAGRDID